MRLKEVLLLLLLSLILAACGEEGIETNMNKDVIDFEFTTQDKDTLSLDDLKGNYWISNFIFTNCITTCPPMTANMKALQDMMAEEGIDDVQLISFSIDPDNDTPEALKQYGELFDADFSNWSFLTGYDFDEIRDISVKSFKSLLIEAQEGSNQVTHGTSFFLVNPEGKVIKSYNGRYLEDMDPIMDDLIKLTD